MFLIVKYDLYYRPKSQGYTGIKDHAGRYTLDEVAVMFPNMESENQDGMTFIAEEDAPEFSKACFWDLKLEHVTKQRDSAQAEIARLTSEVERLRDIAEGERIAISVLESATHNAAIEAAAQRCDLLALADFEGGALMRSAQRCAGVVRALKRPVAGE